MKKKEKIIFSVITLFVILTLLISCVTTPTDSKKTPPESDSLKKLKLQRKQHVKEERTIQVLANGYGTTLEEAKEDVFRNAIEKAVGIYIDATTISENRKIVEDKILKFSNGYVSAYDIIDERQEGNDFYIQYKVKVKINPLSKAIKTNLINNVKTIDLDDLGTSLRSKLNRNKKIFNILHGFFKDLPKSIIIIPTDFKVNEEVGLSEEISVTITIAPMWNQLWIYRLASVLEQINMPESPAAIKWFAPRTGSFQRRKGRGYRRGYNVNRESFKTNYIFPTYNIKDCHFNPKILEKLIRKYIEKLAYYSLAIEFYEDNEMIFKSSKTIKHSIGFGYKINYDKRFGVVEKGKVLMISHPVKGGYYLGDYHDIIIKVPVKVIEQFNDIEIKLLRYVYTM